jgi:Ca-activated chloride channel family protein
VSFSAPGFVLFGAVLIPVIGFLMIRFEQARRQLLRRYGDESLLRQSSSLSTRRTRITADLLALGSLTLLLLALARPQWGERPSSLNRTGRDLLVLLDLSRSMNAADGNQARLTQAKRLVTEVLAAAPGHRVGLIVFGGSAFLQLPLTTNYAAFERFLAAATTDDIGDPATDLPSALAAAATAFEHDGERGYQSVLLVSDGESGPGDSGPALARLRRAKIPVLAVGVGSPEGAPVPADSTQAPEKWHRDHIGRIVVSQLQEGEMRRAARETEGRYLRWAPGAARSVGRTLEQLSRRPIISADAVERVDRYQWPLGIGIVLLALEPLAGRLRRKRSR